MTQDVVGDRTCGRRADAYVVHTPPTLPLGEVRRCDTCPHPRFPLPNALHCSVRYTPRGYPTCAFPLRVPEIAELYPGVRAWASSYTPPATELTRDTSRVGGVVGSDDLATPHLWLHSARLMAAALHRNVSSCQGGALMPARRRAAFPHGRAVPRSTSAVRPPASVGFTAHPALT